MPNNVLRRLTAALLMSVLLLSACASTPPLWQPAPQPTIPPLPAAARQIDSQAWLDSVLADLQRWSQSLAEPSSEGKPAKPSTTR